MKTSIGCIHVFGLFVQRLMAAGSYEVCRIGP